MLADILPEKFNRFFATMLKMPIGAGVVSVITDPLGLLPDQQVNPLIIIDDKFPAP